MMYIYKFCKHEHFVKNGFILLILEDFHVTVIQYNCVRYLWAKGGDSVKTTGIVRNLDNLGRVTLPIELRRNLSLDIKDPVEIFVEGDAIILKKYAQCDIFTGDKEDLIEYHGKMVSRKSIEEMAKIAGL